MDPRLWLMAVPALGFVTRLGCGGWRGGLWVKLWDWVSLGDHRIRCDGALEGSVLHVPAVTRAWARDT